MLWFIFFSIVNCFHHYFLLSTIFFVFLVNKDYYYNASMRSFTSCSTR